MIEEKNVETLEITNIRKKRRGKIWHIFIQKVGL
jgi:hypothetical protein